MIEANLYLNVLMISLAFYAIMEHNVIFRHATGTYEVNIATSWMISKIKKVNIELFFYFFSESRHDFTKFSLVKQVIKKCEGDFDQTWQEASQTFGS